MNDIREYLKKAFELKAEGLYKEALDYLYKAFAIDNSSIEIMSELAFLYTKLKQYERASNFYEQILESHSNDDKTIYNYALLCKQNKDLNKAKELLIKLFNKEFELIKISETLFNILYEQNSFEEIIELYLKKANKLKSAILYYYIAQAYSKNGQESIAQEFFKKSFEADENNIESGCKIAQMLIEQEKYQEAESILKKLLKHSENDKIYFLFAEIYSVKSDVENAMKYYSMAIRLNDKNPQYFYKLGIIYSLKGFLKEAQDMFKRAVDIEHDNLLYNYTLAYSYFVNNELNYAQKIINYILVLNNEYLPALALQLIISTEQNDISSAKKTAESILNRSDKDDYTYYAISKYYLKLNLYNKAYDNIIKAVNHTPGSIEYNYEFAKCCYKLKDYKKALDTCNYINTLNNKFINSYILSAKIYYEQENYNQAQLNIKKVLNLDINMAEAYFIKGNIEQKLLKLKEAEESYKTAISISPNNHLYYASLGQLYYDSQDYKSAYLYYKEAADIDVINPEYKYFMAKCSEYNDDSENALVNYSFVKRLAPYNENYLSEYIKYLCKLGKKKQALKIIKSSSKYFENTVIARLRTIV